MRTTSGFEGPTTLEATPSGHRDPGHRPNGSRQPHVLEESKNGEPKSSPLVCTPTRLQPTDQTRPRETTCSGGHAIETPIG